MQPTQSNDDSSFQPFYIIKKAVPKIGIPNKLGSNTYRILFKSDVANVPEKFAVALSSDKAYADIGDAKQSSIFDKMYKVIYGHDRWLPMQVGEKDGKPIYVKVNYASVQERLFEGDSLEEIEEPKRLGEAVKNRVKDLAFREKLDSIDKIQNNAGEFYQKYEKGFFRTDSHSINTMIAYFEHHYEALKRAHDSIILGKTDNSAHKHAMDKVKGELESGIKLLHKHLLKFTNEKIKKIQNEKIPTCSGPFPQYNFRDIEEEINKLKGKSYLTEKETQLLDQCSKELQASKNIETSEDV